jgi:hypothetical protein
MPVNLSAILPSSDQPTSPYLRQRLDFRATLAITKRLSDAGEVRTAESLIRGYCARPADPEPAAPGASQR